jgi:hypothetical protein
MASLALSTLLQFYTAALIDGGEVRTVLLMRISPALARIGHAPERQAWRTLSQARVRVPLGRRGSAEP